MAPVKFCSKNNSTAGATRTYAIDLGVSTSAGDTLAVCVVHNNTTVYATACTDSAGNLYTKLQDYHTASPCQAIFVSPGATGGSGGGQTAALSSGSASLSVTVSSTAAGIGYCVGVALPGVGAKDQQVGPTATTGVTSGSVAITPGADNQTLLGFAAVSSAATTVPAFGSPGTDLTAQGTGPYNDACYDVVTGGSGVQVTLTSSWTTAANVRMSGLSFQPGVSTISGSCTITGSGSISATPAQRIAASASLSGTGSISATPAQRAAAAATLTGTGSLDATGTSAAARVSVTFGTQSSAGTVSGGVATLVIATRYTATEGGTLDKVTVYNPGGAGTFKAALYADSAGAPGSRLAQQATAASIGAASWGEISLSATITGGTAYWLAIITSADSMRAYKAGSANQAAYITSATFPDPFGSPTYQGNDYIAYGWVSQAGPSLSGTGSLTAAALVVTAASASLSGTGSLTAAAARAGAATLSGSGSVTAPARLPTVATASGTGTLTATAARAAVASLAGTGTVTAAPTTAQQGSCEITGTGTLTAVPTTAQQGSATLEGTGYTDATGTPSGVTVTNSAEGITPSGTTLTPGSSGNTGGTSGDYYDDVSIGSGATLVSDSTYPAAGSLGLHFVTTASATDYVGWSSSHLGTTAATVWVRFYLRFEAAPGANYRILNWLSGTSLCGGIGLTTGRALRLVNSASATVVQGGVLPTGTQIRIEGWLTGDASNGSMQVSAWWTDPQSTGTPDWDSGVRTGVASTGPASRARYGVVTATASIDVRMDELGASTTTWVGPAGTGITPGSCEISGSGTIAATVTQRVTAAISGPGSVSASGSEVAPAAGAAALSGAGSLDATGSEVVTGVTYGTVSLSGTGTLSATATQRATATATGTGFGSGVPTVLVQATGAATLGGTGLLTAVTPSAAPVYGPPPRAAHPMPWRSAARPRVWA